MEIAETITLAVAILLIVGEFISLLTVNSKVTEGKLAVIVWLPIFTLMAITVVLLHLSSLHLIWLLAVSVILSVLALLLPWVQRIALGVYLVLSFRNIINELEEFEDEQDDDEQGEFFSEIGGSNRSKLVSMQPLFKGIKKNKPQGFG
jgi:hypothetical protein